MTKLELFFQHFFLFATCKFYKVYVYKIYARTKGIQPIQRFTLIKIVFIGQCELRSDCTENRL